MFVADVDVIGVVETIGRIVDAADALVFGEMIFLLAILGTLIALDELDSIILPSLSANRIGRSRMPERSADVFAVVLLAFPITSEDVEAEVLIGVKCVTSGLTVVAGTSICWLLMIIFLLGGIE